MVVYQEVFIFHFMPGDSVHRRSGPGPGSSLPQYYLTNTDRQSGWVVTTRGS
jgi:hypothetical protein